MTSTDRMFQLFLQLLAVAFLVYAVFIWYKTGEVKGFAALGAVYSWWFSFYFSKEYKLRSSPEKVLNRNGSDLLIQPASGLLKTFKPTELEVDRISKVTITDNYLSIILDQNGQGYDFHIKADKQAIKSRLVELLSEEESQRLRLAS